MTNNCGNCGNQLVPGDQFCRACGASTGVSQPVQPVDQFGQPNGFNQPNNYNQPMNNQQQVKGKTPGTAVAALVISVIGLFIASLPLGIVSISLGSTALNHYKSFPNDTGKGLAITGIVIGIIEIILVIPTILGLIK